MTISLVDTEATKLYHSEKAIDFRNQLNMLSAEISEHQYWLTMLDRRYKAMQADYLKYLKIDEEMK